MLRRRADPLVAEDDARFRTGVLRHSALTFTAGLRWMSTGDSIAVERSQAIEDVREGITGLKPSQAILRVLD